MWPPIVLYRSSLFYNIEVDILTIVVYLNYRIGHHQTILNSLLGFYSPGNVSLIINSQRYISSSQENVNLPKYI